MLKTKYLSLPRTLVAALLLGLLAMSHSAPAIAAGPPASSLYVVQYGDTLESIAARFGVTVETILQANGMSSPYMYVGQQMSVPYGYGPQLYAPPAYGSTNYRPSTVYIVQPGDTLWAIAKAEYGDGKQWKRIYEFNKDVIKDPNRPRKGTKIKLPIE